MKSQLFLGFALTALSAVLGLPQQAKAYNLEACAKDPMTSAPQVINLLQPIDQKMMNCIPKLDSVANQWRSKADGILSAINGVRIGNQGENGIEKLEYNVTGNTISLIAKVRAKHTWKETIPAVKTKVPVDKWRWVNVPYPDVRWNRKCRLRVCVNVPEPFTNYRKEKVPYTVMEIRTITPEKVVSATASATCKYDYTFNLSTLEQKPIFNCGQGSLGNYKLDASAITKILNGEMPTLGSLLTSVSLTPPLFKDGNRDSYNDERNKMIAAHPNSLVYFSSQSFVEWASAENHGPNIVLAAVSGGGYAPELMRQIEERLTTELGFLGTWASQTAVNLGAQQLISMLTTGEVMNLGGFSISVKAVNVPYVYQKCVVNGECAPELKSPRLGFAIIATRS
ncbi:hypothetical protein ACKFKF_31105 [Phormidesmis sp. 146-12]